MNFPIFAWIGLNCVLVRPVIEDATTSRQRQKLYLSRNERFLVINVNQYIISWCVRNGFCEGRMRKVIFHYITFVFCIQNSNVLAVLTQLLFYGLLILVLRQASVLLQRADGALTHHWPPSKLSVVDHFDHQWRHIEVLPGQPLGMQNSSCRSNVILIFSQLIQLNSLVLKTFTDRLTCRIKGGEKVTKLLTQNKEKVKCLCQS